jgi:hypothetical protein
MTLNGGIQYWTVPATGIYNFTLAGAGVTNPQCLYTIKTSYGIVMTANYTLARGHVIAILVGQQGLFDSAQSQSACGGCGATFIYNNSTATLLFVAGGAGGVGAQNRSASGENATLSTTGATAIIDLYGAQGAGGIGPSGGTGENRSTGGAGYSGNGGQNTGGIIGTVPQSFINGGAGGVYTSGGETGAAAGTFNGGFGGGGYGSAGAGGGGGGYGGGGGARRDSAGSSGGGGGSYDITGAYSGSATNTGQGYVTVAFQGYYTATSMIQTLPILTTGANTVVQIGNQIIHTFTTLGSNTFTIPSNITINAQVLIVAGGGSGGGGGNRAGGGGGAGGLIYTSQSLTSGTQYTAFIGAGGSGGSTGLGTNGSNSSLGSQLSTLVAIGGGAGGGNSATGNIGGSGGGDDQNTRNGTIAGTAGQGNAGGRGAFTSVSSSLFYTGGGGGGAGGNGVSYVSNSGFTVASAGGVGAQYSISGVATYYAGGGGAGGQNAGLSGSAAPAALGGGGVGAYGGDGSTNPSPGGTNGNIPGGNATYYGGGGGGGSTGGTGGAGYQGIIIISYSYSSIILNNIPLSSVGHSGAPLFSQLSTAARNSTMGAFSLRAVNGTSAKAVNVRNGTTSATQDFYADRLGNLLTVPITGQSLGSWLGSATGYIATWYDQSGKGNHMSCSSTGIQPKIDLVNNWIDFKTSAYFDTSANTGAGPTPWDSTKNYTIVCHHNTIGNSAGGLCGSYEANATNKTNNFRGSSGGYVAYWYGGADQSGGTYAVGNKVTFKWDGTNRYIYGNGTLQTTTPSSGWGQTISALQLIGKTTADVTMNGEMYSIFMFNTALSDTDRVVVEGAS